MGSSTTKPKEHERIVLLSGGVGGARLARGLDMITDQLTIIVNTGDDEQIYGLHISPDIDTVAYTLAGIQGPAGWGIRDDSYTVMDSLDPLGVDTTFRLGDRDLATAVARTMALEAGMPLSSFTETMATALGIEARILPATDDRLRTMLLTEDGEWLSFQDYFVKRRHADTVIQVDFDGAAEARPGPGVLEAIEAADRVIIGPSNPPLSIWPILAITDIRDAVAARPGVVAVSPLIGAKAVKGPAAAVLASLGLGVGTAGVAAAYEGLIGSLVVDNSDAADEVHGIEIRATSTSIASPRAAERLARWL